MGNDVTITVPAELAGLFRDNVLHHYEMRADCLDVSARRYALEDDDARKGSREDVLAERDKLHAVEPILDQTDWTNGREAPAGALEIIGRKDLLCRLLRGCLCDIGAESASTPGGSAYRES